MDGLLVICKERGFTSFDVVAKLRGILHTRKIGHTGTLDPQAEGVLPVCLGKGTRLAELLTDHEKTYEAVLRLGITTDTQDMTGTVLSQKPVNVSEEQVRRTILGFLGVQLQVPPMYSALKVGGKKLCDLAREGQVVERIPRPVLFYEIFIEEMCLPRVRFTVRCSKGTYIRTLCHDIGEKLGCGGCMESLLRTRVGDYSLKDCHTLSQVEDAVQNGTISDLVIPVEEILGEYPCLYSLPEGDKLLKNGNPILPGLVSKAPGSSGDPGDFCGEEVFAKPGSALDGDISGGAAPAEFFARMYLSDKTFVGLYFWDYRKRRFAPKKMFL